MIWKKCHNSERAYIHRGKGTGLGNLAHKSAPQKGVSIAEGDWRVVEMGRVCLFQD